MRAVRPVRSAHIATAAVGCVHVISGRDQCVWQIHCWRVWSLIHRYCLHIEAIHATCTTEHVHGRHVRKRHHRRRQHASTTALHEGRQRKFQRPCCGLHGSRSNTRRCERVATVGATLPGIKGVRRGIAWLVECAGGVLLRSLGAVVGLCTGRARRFRAARSCSRLPCVHTKARRNQGQRCFPDWWWHHRLRRHGLCVVSLVEAAVAAAIPASSLATATALTDDNYRRHVTVVITDLPFTPMITPWLGNEQRRPSNHAIRRRQRRPRSLPAAMVEVGLLLGTAGCPPFPCPRADEFRR